jgi:hypothetical protein
LAPSFEAYCQDSLFVPLGMDETSWFLANLDSSNVAIPYRWTASGHVRFPHYGAPFYPAFQLRTSTQAFARFLTAFMQCGEVGGVRVLDCPTVELMTTVQYPDIAPMWGLFWFRIHYGGRWLWAHDGSYYGCKTVMSFCPAENSGVVILTNGDSMAHIMIMHEILEYAAATTSVTPAEGVRATPVRVVLHQNRPNPFNPVTVIPYELSAAGAVSLRIYGVQGRLVRSLLDRHAHTAGRHAVRWDGRDARGRPVGSGVYFYRMEVEGKTATRPMVVIR